MNGAYAAELGCARKPAQRHTPFWAWLSWEVSRP